MAFSARPILTLLLLTCGACGIDDGKTTSESSGSETSQASTGDTTSNASTSSGSSGSSGSTAPTTGQTTDMPTTSGGSSGSSGDTSTGEPDPNFERECQKGDFVCDDFGCEHGEVVKLSQCYKRCTPSAIGGPDDECDEPERPFCSQVGLAGGGDFDCNDCAHICVAEGFDQCDQNIESCAG